MLPYLRYNSLLLCFCLLLCFTTSVQGQKKHSSLTNAEVAGEWLITINYFNNPLEQPVSFKGEGSGLTAHLGNDTAALAVTQNGNTLYFISKDTDSSSADYTGTFGAEEAKGTVIMYDPVLRDSVVFNWKAIRLKTTPPSAPHTLTFTPTTFERGFSALTPPVLHIWPMDTVRTESVDAGGMDKRGVKRVLGGNPLTGPFYIETALPGDVLAITITHLALNRPWAISTNGMVDRAVTNDYAQKTKGSFEEVKWHLDLEKGVASPEKQTEHLKNYSVLVKPMLGCVGVAPWFGSQPIRTGDSGPFGGNMDFNEIVEGATVYLPVFRAGGLLYLGDAHALQGDGELTGDALETSMDIEFTVKVIKDKNFSVRTPRVENATYIMTIGLSGSLDDAFRQTSSELAGWLEQQYRLTPQETAQVLGTAIEYQICEVADRNVGVVAKIKKERLATLSK